MLGSALSPHNYGEGEKGERALGIENPYPIVRLSSFGLFSLTVISES